MLNRSLAFEKYLARPVLVISNISISCCAVVDLGKDLKVGVVLLTVSLDVQGFAAFMVEFSCNYAPGCQEVSVIQSYEFISDYFGCEVVMAVRHANEGNRVSMEYWNNLNRVKRLLIDKALVLVTEVD